jgi:translation initiation factor 5A
MSDDDCTFENTDAGAALFTPSDAGSIRKGGHVMLKEKPCKIVDIATAKPGKHGASKCMFTGIDIFTAKKYEETYSSHSSVNVPIVNRLEYTVLDIGADGNISLLTASGETKDDLNLPLDPDGNPDPTAQSIQKMFDDGLSVLVIVLAAVGTEKIIEAREQK